MTKTTAPAFKEFDRMIATARAERRTRQLGEPQRSAEAQAQAERDRDRTRRLAAYAAALLTEHQVVPVVLSLALPNGEETHTGWLIGGTRLEYTPDRPGDQRGHVRKGLLLGAAGQLVAFTTTSGTYEDLDRVGATLAGTRAAVNGGKPIVAVSELRIGPDATACYAMEAYAAEVVLADPGATSERENSLQQRLAALVAARTPDSSGER